MTLGDIQTNFSCFFLNVFLISGGLWRTRLADPLANLKSAQYNLDLLVYSFSVYVLYEYESVERNSFPPLVNQKILAARPRSCTQRSTRRTVRQTALSRVRQHRSMVSVSVWSELSLFTFPVCAASCTLMLIIYQSVSRQPWRRFTSDLYNCKY